MPNNSVHEEHRKEMIGLLFFKDLFLSYECMFWLHLCKCTPYVQCLQRPENGVRSHRTGVTEGCEPPCECWKPNLGLLQAQPVFVTAELYLQFQN